MLLLCTDGLTDVVANEEIEPAIHGLEIQTAAQKLINLACQRGGQDNITAVMLLVPWGAVPDRKAGRFWQLVWISLAGLILFSLIVALLGWAIFTYLLPPS
jgi:protein-S-isoprenylcysteine O-methyltransferase Ste14